MSTTAITEAQPSADEATATPRQAREPYVAPVIEKFPPMTDVSFGTNIQPTMATSIAFP